MPEPIVAVLEPFDIKMQKQIRAIVGPGLDLIFPNSVSEFDFKVVLQNADYAVVRAIKLPGELLEFAPKLRAIHQWGTGIDGLPTVEARQRGIIMARSPGKNAPSVADMTIGLMLATLRRIVVADKRVRDGHWLEPNLYSIARDLTGLSVGLVGFGAIGQAVAKRLAGFDCHISYTRVSGPLDGCKYNFTQLSELVKNCDVISLHLPLNSQTSGLFDYDLLSTIKTGAVFINTARGGLVDQDALAQLLHSGQISGAGLDTFVNEPLEMDSPLRDAPNTVFTPHCSGGTRDNLERIVNHWANNLRDLNVFKNLNPNDLV